MPRTKKRFIEEVNTSTAPVESSSAEEDDAPNAYSSFGGGKQLRPMGGGGKQIRLMQSDDDVSEDEDSDDEEPDTQPQQNAYVGRPGGGKQFRPAMGRGKQLRFPQNQQESEEEKSEAEEEEVEEEESEPEPEPEPLVRRGGGKSLMSMQQRGGGKQLYRPPVEDEEEEEEEADESDESSEEEVEEETFVPAPRRGGKSLMSMQRGGGKQLVRPEVEAPVEAPEENSESSDEEDEIISKPAVAKDMDMDIDDSDDSDAEVPLQPTTPSRITRGTAPAETNEESEEDDMEESSDDDESEEEKELDFETLDEKQLIKNEADRELLDSLPEVERESILAERFEELKAAQDMKRALRDNKRKEREKRRLAGGNKTKPSKGKKAVKKPITKPAPMPDTSKDAELAADLALGRTAKNRDVSGVKAKKKAALDKMRKDRSDAKEKDDSDLDYGDDDDDDDDDDYNELPWANSKVKKVSRLSALARDDDDEDSDHGGRTQRVLVEADLEDFVKVTVPRRRLSRWCNEPYFEKSVMGFYVRLAIGRDKNTQKPCYRLCKIVGIQTGKQYQFPQTAGNASGKPISTNKWLSLKFGEFTKEFKMLMISDSKPSQDDVRVCLNQMKNRRGGEQHVLSKKDAKKMWKMQDQLVNNYTYTVEDIQRSIAEKKTMTSIVSNIGAEKTKAAIAVKAAETQLEDAKQLEKELDNKVLEAEEIDEEAAKDELEVATSRVEELKEELLKKKEAEKNILDAEKQRRKRLGASEKNLNWAKVNERAKAANKASDFDAYKNEDARAETTAKDLYARRKMNPKILWEVGQKKEEKEIVDKSKTKQSAEASAQEERDNLKKRQDDSRQNASNLKKKLAEQINDLAIEEVALSVGLSNVSHKKVSATRVRKGISIQEYFERKAVGAL